ncbi:GNAT family N-acetyltransferase [Phenylobacterium sp.]|uniref:GNAT family N-acetyltransferase n=1 Tax=Phenylobacterium sp. TaxID=1871053 RepID=UPI00356A91BF
MRILETGRLALDELVPADAPFILELVDSPAFRDNIGDRGVRDLDGARGYIEGVALSYAKHGFGLWRATLKATGEPVGICGLVKRDGLDLPDVGYALLQRFWGQGFATEAAAAVLAHGHRMLDLPVISAITKPANLGSIAVLEKIGLKFLGLRVLPGSDSESSYFETA